MYICVGCVYCEWNVAVSLLIKLCQCLSTIDAILAQGQRPAAGSQVFLLEFQQKYSFGVILPIMGSIILTDFNIITLCITFNIQLFGNTDFGVSRISYAECVNVDK